MKLSNDTLSLLKNFAMINSNIVIEAGSQLKTINEAKNVMGYGAVAETFPMKFGIYDLGEFLNVYHMFEDPELNFDADTKAVVISQGKRSVRYRFSDPEILTTVAKDIKMPKADLAFNLSSDDLASIRKATSVLGVSDVVITNNGNESLLVTITDVKNSTANQFAIELPCEGLGEEEFSLIFNISNFKMVQADYDVEISSKLISQFTNASLDVKYFIALEKSSTYGG